MAGASNHVENAGGTRPRERPLALRRENKAVLRAFVSAIGPDAAPVCMFTRFPIDHDARIKREIKTLSGAGLRVAVFSTTDRPEGIGWSVDGPVAVVRIYHKVTFPRWLAQRMLVFQRWYQRMWRRRARLFRLPFALAAVIARASARRAGTRATSARRLEERFTTWSRPRPGHRGLGTRAIRSFRLWFRASTTSLNGALFTWYFDRLTSRFVVALRPAAYHCHDEQTMPAGVLAKRRYDAPLIYDSHELWPHRNRLRPAWWKTRAFEILDRRVARRADAVITVSRAIASHMERRYGLAHVDVVMNTPETAGAEDTPVSLEGIPRPRLFVASNLTINRGLDEAIRAMSLLPSCTLVVLGIDRVGYRKTLESLAVELGVTDRVVFLDPVPSSQVVAVARQADVSLILLRPICLSYLYALPNKFFESLHAGLPVVSSDLPEMRRLIDELGVGEIVDQEDPRAIADGVRRVIEDPARRAALSHASRDAATTYRWEHEQEKLLAIYERLGILAGRRTTGDHAETTGGSAAPASANDA